MEHAAPENMETLLRRAHELRADIAKGTARLVAGGLLMLLAFAALLALITLISDIGNREQTVFLLFILQAIFGSVFGAGGRALRARYRRAYTRLLLEIAQRHDKSALGLLLDEMWNSDLEARKAVHASLYRLLPKLERLDAQLLDAKQREKLYLLPFTIEPLHDNLRFAALKAIGEVGNSRALQMVKKYKSGFTSFFYSLRNPDNPYGQRRLVMQDESTLRLRREAVEECIAALEARLTLETAGATHLRAASAPTVDPENLLHPAAYADTTEPQQLLRVVTDAKEGVNPS